MLSFTSYRKAAFSLISFGALLCNVAFAASPSNASELPASVLRASEDAEENMKNSRPAQNAKPSITIDYQGIRNKTLEKSKRVKPQGPLIPKDSNETQAPTTPASGSPEPTVDLERDYY